MNRDDAGVSMGRRAKHEAVLSPMLIQRIGRKALVAAVLSLSPVAAHAEYVVGIFAPLTGPHALIGSSMRNGIVLALETAEDAGRFGDVRLSIRALDDSGAPKAVAARVAKFVKDEQAILVIGPAVSASAEAAADLANHAKFPLLAPGSSEGINATGKWAFRLTMSPYKTIQALAARALVETPRARAAIVYAKGNAGFASQAAEFRSAAQRSGATVAAETAIAIETDFVASSASAIRASGATMVFFAMDAEPAAALARAVVEGVRGVEGGANSTGGTVGTAGNVARAGEPNNVANGIANGTGNSAENSAAHPKFIFAPAAAQPALTRIGGAALEGSLTAADYLPDAPGAPNEQFRSAYRKRFGVEADTWAGTGFAAGQLAADAIRAAGPAPTPDTIRLALERVSDVALLVGAGNWKQDGLRNPQYAPRFFVVRDGRLMTSGELARQ